LLNSIAQKSGSPSSTFRSAPAFISNLTISILGFSLCSNAFVSAVFFLPSLKLTFAPAAKRSLTSSGVPCPAASIIAVVQFLL
jgi:hypothetical protein